MDNINNHSKYFWLLQLVGWSLMGLFNLFIQVLSGYNYRMAIINAVSIFIGGLFFTSIMRYFFKKNNWQDWKMINLVLISIATIVIVSFVWTICVMLLAMFTVDGFSITGIQLFAGAVPLGMIVTIWTLIYFTYQLLKKYHFNKIKRLELQTEIQRAQLGTLKSQINPHFLFNTLNNIKALMLEDVDLARKMLTNFSELFSYSLQHAEKKEVLLEEELEVLGKYLELIKIQYEEKLKYEINVDSDLYGEFIPPMILQLLVENAIKHGVSQELNGGEVIVNVSKKENTILIQVKNTGSLKNKNKLETTLGIGQRNIKERLALIYQNNALLKMIEEPPFVVVEIKINK